MSVLGSRLDRQPQRMEILQVQLIYENFAPLTDGERAEYEKLFKASLALVRDRCVQGLKKP